MPTTNNPRNTISNRETRESIDDMCSTDIFLGVLALMFPPLPVWVKCGICSADSLINILLCMLGFFPGLLHAWYIIAKYPEPAWEYEALAEDSERAGRVTYVFVRDDGSHQVQGQNLGYGAVPPRYQPQPKPQPQPSYGTQGPAQGSASRTFPQPAPQQQGVASFRADEPAAAGPSSGAVLPDDGTVPPSYAEAVGDHKIQNRD